MELRLIAEIQDKRLSLQTPKSHRASNPPVRTRPPQRRGDCKDLTFRLAARLEWSTKGNGRIYTQFPSFLLSHMCNLGTRVHTHTHAHTHKLLLACNEFCFSLFLSISVGGTSQRDKCRPDVSGKWKARVLKRK